MPSDEKVYSWNHVQKVANWSSILIGNGSSIAVWPAFAYQTIFDKACSGIQEPLEAEDIALFRSFSTTNFERVLFALLLGRMVNSALGLPVDEITARYTSIRNSLFQAVKAVHIPFSRFQDAQKQIIRAELSKYQNVFSTNYDLVLYLSILAYPGPEGFIDFFWNDGIAFDLGNTTVWERSTGERPTKIYYLHGGIHLFKTHNGLTFKRRLTDIEALLDSVQNFAVGESTPLFVSEGRSNEKLESISNSDYLSFAFNSFSENDEPIIVFGHSLSSESDQHLSKAINKFRGRKVAVSISPDLSDEEKAIRIHQTIAAIPNAEILFYDSSSFPLGDQKLLVT